MLPPPPRLPLLLSLVPSRPPCSRSRSRCSASPPRYAYTLELQSEAYASQILRPLVDDGLVIVDNEVVVVGRGPLSQLVRKLKQLRVPYVSCIDLSER